MIPAERGDGHDQGIHDLAMKSSMAADDIEQLLLEISIKANRNTLADAAPALLRAATFKEYLGH